MSIPRGLASHTLNGPGETHRRGPLDCRDCGSRLAVDQRYCVDCGTRARGCRPISVKRWSRSPADTDGRRRHRRRWSQPRRAVRGLRSHRSSCRRRAPRPRRCSVSWRSVSWSGAGRLSFASLPLNLVVNGVGGHAAVNAPAPVADNASAGTGGSQAGSGASSAGAPSSDAGTPEPRPPARQPIRARPPPPAPRRCLRSSTSG